MNAQCYATATAPGDVRELAENLRHADRLELEAIGQGVAGGKTPLELLIESYLLSTTTITIRRSSDGSLAAVAGSEAQSGLVWMMGTPVLETVQRTFLRCSRGIVKGVLGRGRPYLWNYVDSRNDRHVRWLRWIGADINRQAPLVIQGVPFYPFTINT